MQALALASTWPVDHSAVGVLSRSASLPSAGIEVVTAGDTERVYEWASVSKLCTALALLVAVEEKTVALSDPAGPPGATVAHLLAHASGLGPGNSQAAISAPGQRRIYSNTGFELLAELLADRSGLLFSTYLREAVFEPLRMASAVLAPEASAARDVRGSLSDLLALGTELLLPRLISVETWQLATSVAFGALPGVLPGFGFQDPCDWGLGLEIKDAKYPHWTGSRNSAATFGHFGQSGGFLWVDPARAVACGALTDRPFGNWAASGWPIFSDAVLSELDGGAMS